MKRLIFNIFRLSLFMIICWVVSTGIRFNWNFNNLYLDFYATMQKFNQVYIDDWNNMISTLGDGFKNIKFNVEFEYVSVNDLNSFFANIGIWFNGVFALLTDFFRLVGGILSTIGFYIYHVIKIISALFEFIFYPVIRVRIYE